MQGLLFLAAVVLAFTGHLTSWWGIVVLVVAALLSIGVATARENPEARTNTVEVFTLVLPTVAAIYVGDALWHPWGAIVGALAMNPIGTLVADAALVRIYRWPTEPGTYEYGPGNANGREAKRHARSCRRQGVAADYVCDDAFGWSTVVP